MPNATTSTEDIEKFELKSCPGGFVVLRRLNYGEYLKRREMVSGLKIHGGQRSKDFEGELQMASRKVTEFEFASSIVDHNLTDEGGTPLDFRNTFTFNMLDPRVGEEIGTLIDRMNQWQEEVEAGNSRGGSDA